MTIFSSLRANRLFLFLTVFTVFFAAGILPAWAKENKRYASIVIDADTGVILSQSNADKPLHPASLTKIMTLLMAFEAMEQGKLSPRDRIRISKHAASMVPSKLGLSPGSTIKVQDAIYAIVTKSANDIAVALAEQLGGTETNFARMMTNRARQLGMANTTFTNASGLHDPRQYSSARDMATLARFVINTYPSYYRYFSTANFTYQGHSYHNHNRLMETYKGMDGMKTGYVGPSGFNLVASAVRNDRRIIGVVFGGRSAASRNTHMANLLDSGFARVGDSSVLIASADARSPAPVPPRKPAILVALNTLNKVSNGKQDVKLASLGPVLDPVKFGELVGEGDIDPAESRRIETGLVAVSAIKGKGAKPEQRVLSAPSANDTWAVQIGAYSSRAATDQALHAAARKIPASLGGGNPVIAPLKVKDGWMFRARLSGYTRAQAFKACTYIKDCMPVAPQNN